MSNTWKNQYLNELIDELNKTSVISDSFRERIISLAIAIDGNMAPHVPEENKLLLKDMQQYIANVLTGDDKREDGLHLYEKAREITGWEVPQ